MKKQIVSGVMSAAIAVTGFSMVLAAPKKAAKGAKVVSATKKTATVKTPAKKAVVKKAVTKKK